MQKYRNLTLFLVLSAMWGTSFMAIKAGLTFYPPVFYAAIRFYIAGSLMLTATVLETDYWYPREKEGWCTVFISAFLMFMVYHAFLYIGELFTTSAVAAIIVSLSPLLTSGFSRALLPSECVTLMDLLGILLGLLGIVIIARPNLSDLLTPTLLGKGLIFVAVASYALGSVLVRRTHNSLPQKTLIAWAMLLGAVMMHGISMLRRETLLFFQWQVGSLLPVLYLSLVSGFLGYLIYFDLLERFGPLEINLVSYLTPVFASITGWIFLQESIEIVTVMGFFVIFAGFLLIKRNELRSEIRPGE